jgi:hypothetical protein
VCPQRAQQEIGHVLHHLIAGLYQSQLAPELPGSLALDLECHLSSCVCFPLYIPQTEGFLLTFCFPKCDTAFWQRIWHNWSYRAGCSSTSTLSACSPQHARPGPHAWGVRDAVDSHTLGGLSLRSHSEWGICSPWPIVPRAYGTFNVRFIFRASRFLIHFFLV